MNPSELERQSDEHGPVKSGVVFDRACHARIDRRTGQPATEPPSIEAALRAQLAALTSELSDKAARIAAMEVHLAAARQALAVKEQLVASMAQRIAAQAELLGRRGSRRETGGGNSDAD